MFKKTINLIKYFPTKYPEVASVSLFIIGLIVFVSVALTQLDTSDKSIVDGNVNSQSESDSLVLGTESNATLPEKVETEAISQTPSVKITQKQLPTNSPTTTPTKIITPTNIPTQSPTPSPIPTTANISDGTCSIIADITNGTPPLQVKFAYSANYDNAENWVTAVQWDFNGDGVWDTDMAYEEVNKRPIHIYNTGIYTAKMHLQLANGYITDRCSLTITAE